MKYRDNKGYGRRAPILLIIGLVLLILSDLSYLIPGWFHFSHETEKMVDIYFTLSLLLFPPVSSLFFLFWGVNHERLWIAGLLPIVNGVVFWLPMNDLATQHCCGLCGLPSLLCFFYSVALGFGILIVGYLYRLLITYFFPQKAVRVKL